MLVRVRDGELRGQMITQADTRTNRGKHDTITVQDNPKAEQFEAHIDGDVAVAAYVLLGNTIMFTHTEVPEHLQGQGVASRLVGEALAAAKARGLWVIPMCAFVDSYIRRHPEYHDQVHFAHRTVEGVGA